MNLEEMLTYWKLADKVLDKPFVLLNSVSDTWRVRIAITKSKELRLVYLTDYDGTASIPVRISVFINLPGNNPRQLYSSSDPQEIRLKLNKLLEESVCDTY